MTPSPLTSRLRQPAVLLLTVLFAVVAVPFMVMMLVVRIGGER